MFSITLALWFALLPAELVPNGEINTVTVESIEHNRVVRLSEDGPRVIVDTVTLKNELGAVVWRCENCHILGMKVQPVQHEFWILFAENPGGDVTLIIRSKVLKESATVDYTPLPKPVIDPPTKEA